MRQVLKAAILLCSTLLVCAAIDSSIGLFLFIQSPRWIHTQPIGLAHPTLGWVLEPNRTVHSVLTTDPTMKWSMTTNALGNRVSPGTEPIAVLGDSFAMGTGVNDDETLAAFLGANTNRGVAGWSPANIVLDLERRPLPDTTRVAVLVLIKDHILRVGGLRLWSLDHPRWELHGTRLFHAGTHWSSRPVQSSVVWGTSLSVFARSTLAHWRPRSPTKTTAALIRVIKEKVAPARLVVADYDPDRRLWTNVPDVAMVDVSGGKPLPEGHPTAMWHKAAAEKLLPHIYAANARPKNL